MRCCVQLLRRARLDSARRAPAPTRRSPIRPRPSPSSCRIALTKASAVDHRHRAARRRARACSRPSSATTSSCCRASRRPISPRCKAPSRNRRRWWQSDPQAPARWLTQLTHVRPAHFAARCCDSASRRCWAARRAAARSSLLGQLPLSPATAGSALPHRSRQSAAEGPRRVCVLHAGRSGDADAPTPACWSTNGRSASPAPRKTPRSRSTTRSRRRARRSRCCWRSARTSRKTWDDDLVLGILQETLDSPKIRTVDLDSVAAGRPDPAGALFRAEPARRDHLYRISPIVKEVSPCRSDPSLGASRRSRRSRPGRGWSRCRAKARCSAACRRRCAIRCGCSRGSGRSASSWATTPARRFRPRSASRCAPSRPIGPGTDDAATARDRSELADRSARRARSRGAAAARLGAARAATSRTWCAQAGIAAPDDGDRGVSRGVPDRRRVPRSDLRADRRAALSRPRRGTRHRRRGTVSSRPRQSPTGQPPPIPLPPEAANPGMAKVLADFVAYRGVAVQRAGAGLRLAAAAARLCLRARLARAGAEPACSNAPEFPGGHLDWYSFSLANGAAERRSSRPIRRRSRRRPSTSCPTTSSSAACPIRAGGTSRTRVTDFGQLDAEHVDLAKLLVMEFALVYGNDWFSVPVPVTSASRAPIRRRGTLSRVTTLVVTDTFGVRTLIRPSEQTQVNPGESPWSMFKLSGHGARSDFIVMAPTLGVVDDADAIEEVLLPARRHGRDGLGGRAPAARRSRLADRRPRNVPRSASRPIRRRRRRSRRPAARRSTTRWKRSVPDNWIPMVPVQSPQGELFLRRGTMEIPTSTGFVDIKARALMLEPEHPFFVGACCRGRDCGGPLFPPHPLVRWHDLRVDGAQAGQGAARDGPACVRPRARHAQAEGIASASGLPADGHPDPVATPSQHCCCKTGQVLEHWCGRRGGLRSDGLSRTLPSCRASPSSAAGDEPEHDQQQHEGSDRTTGAMRRRNDVSIHAPLKGATTAPFADIGRPPRFDPRSREGSDPFARNRLARCPPGDTLALPWQIYSGRIFPQIHFRQCGHSPPRHMTQAHQERFEPGVQVRLFFDRLRRGHERPFWRAAAPRYWCSTGFVYRACRWEKLTHRCELIELSARFAVMAVITSTFRQPK